MSEHIPTGYRHDPYNPEKYLVRCPGCESSRKTAIRPGATGQTCSTCNRLMGVTPISAISPARSRELEEQILTDGGTEVFEGGTERANQLITSVNSALILPQLWMGVEKAERLKRTIVTGTDWESDPR